MSTRRFRNPFERGLFRQAPAEVIRRVRGAGRLHPAHAAYLQWMAVVDAALFTHPDYADLADLAAAVLHDHRPDTHGEHQS